MARNKSKLTCGNCRRPVKATWLGCPRCMKPNAGYRPPGASKAARPALGKMGSARCPVGHLTRAGANFCTTCGQPMQQGSFKSAAAVRARPVPDPNPLIRNIAYYNLHPELTPPWSKS